MNGEAGSRLLGKEEYRRIVDSIFSLQEGGGSCEVKMVGWWNGEIRWGRNRVYLAADRRDLKITITRSIENAGPGKAITNQFDLESLKGAVKAAERVSRLSLTVQPPELFHVEAPEFALPKTLVWSDSTFSATAEQRSKLTDWVSDTSERNGMIAAGYGETRAQEWAVAESTGSVFDYGTCTQAQCSVTVRHPQGLGSGWAGRSSFDWAVIDGSKLGDIAFEKCMASLNPVRVEPGRYTTILETQAAGVLIRNMMGRFMRPKDSGGAETGSGPFGLGFDNGLRLGRSKLGLQVVDKRISISHQVDDPELGVVPKRGLTSVKLIENGILVSLYEDVGVRGGRFFYSLPWLNKNETLLARGAFRMSGGETSVQEMIESTERGLVVTRFSGLNMVDGNSLLFTGFTRDGLWLVENGKITKAVHNMRFTESPMFVLNSIEQLGVPLPLFSPVEDPDNLGVSPAIVPPMKVNDFSFTALVDAV